MQGLPPWVQLPGICSQRPGLERLVSQTPEQHSASRKQTSWYAWQEKAGRHVPAVEPAEFGAQLPEQHAFDAPTVQESNRVLQPFPPGSAAQAFSVLPTATGSHRPVQHSAPSAQDVPVWAQLAPVQNPASQRSEQHSPDEVHALPPPVPDGLQKDAAMHLESLHIAEQQAAAPPTLQSAPSPPQLTVGDAHAWLAGSQ